MSQKKLTKAQEEFCFRYVLLGDVEEAAAQSGFDRSVALAEGIRCLTNRGCLLRINELREKLADGRCVITGLRRLAFGSCKDAVLLAFSEEPVSADNIGRLDLFNVAEIKRDKGGGVEVRLFDRMKALEKLYELENAASDRDKVLNVMRSILEPEKEVDNE